MAVLKEEVRLPRPRPLPLPQENEAGGGGGGGEGVQEDGNDAAGERGRLMRRNGGGKEGDRVIDVRIPAKVYNDGVRAVRHALEAVVDVID